MAGENLSITTVHYNCANIKRIMAFEGTADVLRKVSPWVVLFLSIIGVNLLYLFTAWKTKQTRRKSSKLFFAMSFSDFMVGAISIPSVMIFWASTSDGICVFFQMVQYIPAVASCCLTFAIALDRYLLLVYKANLELKYFLLFVLVCTTILIAPDVLNFFLYKSSEKYFDADPPTYMMLVFASIFVLLFPILYLHLLWFVKRKSEKSQSLSCQSQYGNRVMKTILLVLLSQVSWYFVNIILRYYLTIFAPANIDPNTRFAIIYMMCMSMCMNSVTSTVVLIWRNTTIRRFLFKAWQSEINSKMSKEGSAYKVSKTSL